MAQLVRNAEPLEAETWDVGRIENAEILARLQAMVLRHLSARRIRLGIFDELQRVTDGFTP